MRRLSRRGNSPGNNKHVVKARGCFWLPASDEATSEFLSRSTEMSSLLSFLECTLVYSGDVPLIKTEHIFSRCCAVYLTALFPCLWYTESSHTAPPSLGMSVTGLP